MTAERKQFDVNFFTPEVIGDPYPLYERIRHTGRVVWNDLLPGWMVVDFDLASEILTDNDNYMVANGDPAMTPWFHAPNMLTVDGDYHRRLRGALFPFFQRSIVNQWEKRIGEVVDSMLQPLATGSESFDLIADFTTLPTVIVAELMGVPPERHADFVRWSHDIVSNLSYGAESPEAQAIMHKAADEVNAFVSEEIERHRRQELDDLMTSMLRLEGDSHMTDEEIGSAAVLLLVAGYDTTAKTMTNALIALEANPEQRRLVARDPTLVPAAIEEAMRWYGPVQFNIRIPTTDVTVAGTPIPAEQPIYVFYSAANRDPKRWEDAHLFEVMRKPKTHLGFGRGPHLCLGNSLARLEVKVALERLLAIAPEYHLSDLDFGPAFFVRGPERGSVAVRDSQIRPETLT